MKRGLLMSGGGLDSLSVVALYHDQLAGIMDVDYGNKGSFGEGNANRWSAQKYGLEYHHILAVPYQLFGIRDNSLLKGASGNPVREGESVQDAIMRNTLEIRNLYIGAHVALMALSRGYDGIMTGFHKEHVSRPSPDATPEFFAAFEKAVHAATDKRLEFRAPFQEQGLERIDILAQSLAADLEVWSHAFNCYESLTNAWCGTCTHCVKRPIWAAELRDKHNIIVDWPQHSQWEQRVPATGTYDPS